MIDPRLILCSGVQVSANHRYRIGRKVVALTSFGRQKNVHIHFEDVAKVFLKHLTPRLTDLMEIAAYVFSADCATRRGSSWSNEGATESWDRNFVFVVPVRDYKFWNRKEVKKLLEETLGFLSDDAYEFDFRKSLNREAAESYFEFSDDDDWPFSGAERVLMFSGGLDSLAGAVDSAEQGEHLVLVSHRSNSVLDSRQRKLVEKLLERYPNKIIHIPVWLNKGTNLDREHTQRTRSFLYLALGAAVAESVRAGGVRFFENGVVSLNLPIADEVLRTRASRTTHPHALALFERLLSLVTERDFKVDNPFLLKTKAEVISVLSAHKASDLIKHTCSCAHTGFFQSKNQWHCGACTQCIDRRIAVVASGSEAHDPSTDYVCDVFIGERKKRHHANVAVAFVRHAFELYQMNEAQMAARFNAELARATRDTPRPSDAARRFIDMHLRHAGAVRSVITSQIARNAEKLADGMLPPTCMLGLVAGQEHLKTTWKRYCDRIADILDSGIPTICQKTKPKDEPHLQEMCDGLLKSHDLTLEREFPFLGWSSAKTKPDWSNEDLRVWVELKYIRTKRDIRQITEDIAADITKYGDNARRTLFVVYDPHHMILDEQKFAAPIETRQEMMVRIIR